MSRVHSLLREIIHSKANIVAVFGSCCSVSVTSLRVYHDQPSFEIVRTCWCAIGAEDSKDAWLPGRIHNQRSQCLRLHDDDRRRPNSPPFRDSHVARMSRLKKGWYTVEMSWACSSFRSLRRHNRSWREISIADRKLPLRLRSETLRLCSSVMSNFASYGTAYIIFLSHGTAYIIFSNSNVGSRKRDR